MIKAQSKLLFSPCPCSGSHSKARPPSHRRQSLPDSSSAATRSSVGGFTYAPSLSLAWNHSPGRGGELGVCRVMAARIAARYVSRRRLSSSGKILSEEEKAAENVYIKKMEQDKLEKLASKGLKTDEATAASHGGGTVTDAKPSASSASGVEKVSIDKYRNFAVLAGTITALGAIGWYVKGTAKKPEVQD